MTVAPINNSVAGDYEAKILANEDRRGGSVLDLSSTATGNDRTGAGVAEPDSEPVKAPVANVGKSNFANAEKSPNLDTYSPFANVGKTPRKVIPMPTLANKRQPLNLGALEWRRSAGKPPNPKGFYWQASGSKTTKANVGKSRILVGWTLVKNGKCQQCDARYRPPVAYLKGESWDSLKGETYERQKAEIRLLLGKCQRRLNDLRCPECLPGNHGEVRIVGAAS